MNPVLDLIISSKVGPQKASKMKFFFFFFFRFLKGRRPTITEGWWIFSPHLKPYWFTVYIYIHCHGYNEVSRASDLGGRWWFSAWVSRLRSWNSTSLTHCKGRALGEVSSAGALAETTRCALRGGKPPWVSLSHSIHGTGIFSYIHRKNQPFM